jgi:hypothetical protein
MDFEFDLNLMKFEIFDSIQRFTTMIRAQKMRLNLRVTTLPLNKSCPEI